MLQGLDPGQQGRVAIGLAQRGDATGQGSILGALQPRLPGAAQQVGVGIDKAGHQRPAAQVNDPGRRPFQRQHLRLVAHGDDAVARDGDGGGLGLTRLHGQDCAVVKDQVRRPVAAPHRRQHGPVAGRLGPGEIRAGGGLGRARNGHGHKKQWSQCQEAQAKGQHRTNGPSSSHGHSFPTHGFPGVYAGSRIAPRRTGCA